MKLTVDPGQQKLVIPLVAILVGAVVVTAVRVKSNIAPAQQTATSASSTGEALEHKATAPALHYVSPTPKSTDSLKENTTGPDDTQRPYRNPFEEPNIPRSNHTVQSSQISPGVISQSSLTQQPKLPPWPINGLRAEPAADVGSAQSQDTTNVNTATKPVDDHIANIEPTYHLTAILEGPMGRAAVVQEDSDTGQVVMEGQVLSGDYRVIKIGTESVVIRSSARSIVLHMPASLGAKGSNDGKN